MALVIVVAWNATQMRSISALETDGKLLREKISAAPGSGSGMADGPSSTSGSKKTTVSRKASIDWKEVSTAVSRAEDGSEKSSLRAMIDFQRRLAEMSRDEIIASLDEINALGLPDSERAALEELILAALIKQDPQYALERFSDRIESDPESIGWQLSAALGDWAKKDLSAAKAWFDKQISEGKFESKTLDGRSEMRTDFEAELMESMIGSDLDAAGRRLAALPEDQRREVLQQLSFDELSPAEQKAYASLVRQLVPSDERAGSFAHIASQLVDDTGYGKVGAFLDSVNATPEERSAAATQTAESRLTFLGQSGDISSKDVDTLRTWLDKQAPGKTNSITGKALAEAAQDGGKFGFDEASQLAIKYQQSSGSDDVLVSFLESYSAHSNIEEARHLAEMISDEKVRARILDDMN